VTVQRNLRGGAAPRHKAADQEGSRIRTSGQRRRVFSDRGRASMNLVITPEKRDPANHPRRYRFEARLEGDDRILCVSHQPFVDAARVLVKEGCDPTEILIMRHAGTEALSAQLGEAAKWMVEEGPSGPPRFIRYRPSPSLNKPPLVGRMGLRGEALHPSDPVEGGADTHAET
jgi:hypothetical protein